MFLQATSMERGSTIAATNTVFRLISFGKRMCKILLFWVSAVSWQYKLAVCNIYVHCLGESCKLLYELVSLLTDG